MDLVIQAHRETKNKFAAKTNNINYHLGLNFPYTLGFTILNRKCFISRS